MTVLDDELNRLRERANAIRRAWEIVEERGEIELADALDDVLVDLVSRVRARRKIVEGWEGDAAKSERARRGVVAQPDSVARKAWTLREHGTHTLVHDFDLDHYLVNVYNSDGELILLGPDEVGRCLIKLFVPLEVPLPITVVVTA